MIKRIKTIAATFILLFITAGSFAQENAGKTNTDAPLVAAPASAPVEMATGLYQSGKIYVVVGVLAIIFIGIIAYLIMLDRKISRIEKDLANK